MNRFGLRFYGAATLVGFGLIWAVGVYLALIGYRGNPAECTSACVDGAIPGLLGILLILVSGPRAFRRFITGPGRVVFKPTESLETGSVPEHEGILAVANELSSKRNLRKRLRSVQTLAWSNSVNWYLLRFRRQGLGKPWKLVLPVVLRDKLDLDDWRTLLDYSFLQQKRTRVLHILTPFSWIALLMILFSIIGATLSFTLGQYSSELFGAATGPIVVVLIVIGLGPAFREMFLRTDAVVAASLGNRKLLDLFEKIDRLQLPENENAKKREGWAARLWPMPTISERIVNLQNSANR